MSSCAPSVQAQIILTLVSVGVRAQLLQQQQQQLHRLRQAQQFQHYRQIHALAPAAAEQTHGCAGPSPTAGAAGSGKPGGKSPHDPQTGLVADGPLSGGDDTSVAQVGKHMVSLSVD